MSTATEFWQAHQVGGPYRDLEESREALKQRAEKFPLLSELMPTDYPGKRILDFGCGPGHDTLQFLMNGAHYVWYADVSWQALQTTSERIRMHHLDRCGALFADDSLPSVDVAHCAGVLHHMDDPVEALLRLRRVSPYLQVMVYDGAKSEHSQSDVPITKWWTPDEFIKLANEAGWQTEYRGSYECSAPWRPNCYAACFSMT